jgi:predicted membrane protein
MNTKKLALLIVLAALCLAIQIIIPRPPNVEFTSFFSFAVGLIEGAAVGAFFGSFVMLINGFLSPVGFGGFNIPFQMAGMMIAGVLGGIYRRYRRDVSSSARFFSETAILGAFIALIYDIVTNLGFGFYLILTGEDSSLAFLTAMANGVPFSLLHVVSNTVVFGTLFLPLMNVLSSLKIGEFHWSKKERLYS